ncbi:endolytic transglycosylase MltG [Anoxybacterium hadale]|uniref:Endolytic transglycosylase MltG n=1 Tax=Anoxybacterium hadale TaxID=3408580 RepID=A0ACD1A8P2_9FIRM|nr:endolytic transglycosylase MltG [Clostridiales bacterium]
MGKRRNKIKNKKRLIFSVVIIIATILLAAAAFFSVYLNKQSEPVNPDNEASVTVVIPNGTGTGGIARILADNELISSESVFKIQSKTRGFDGKYKAGEYSLSPSMSMADIMKILLSGKANTMRFTIPEGYDIRRTTEKLASEGLINPEVFANEIQSGQFDYKFLADAPAGADRLEGFLFPETYDIYTTANEHDIINKMLAQFDKVFTEEYYQRAKELGMSVRDVITLASIIEREAQVSEDRPIIASVFYNRLKISMPLQSCATVQYILGEQKPVLSIKDTQIESPYNTYLNAGLPPGPIASPGADSIKAALYPADTKYLYFLAKGDGSHAFSETYDQFLKDKRKYIN